MDPTLTALAALFFAISLALFAYAWRERRRELAAAAAGGGDVIDLRDPAPVARRRRRETV